MATALTTAQVVAALGASSQMQKWSLQIIYDTFRKSVMAKLMAGNAGGRAIATVSSLKDIKGQTVNFTVRSGLGGPGEQGAAADRNSGGENLKHAMFSLTFGNHHKSVTFNNVTKEQTVIGTNIDADAQTLLSDWFYREREWATEAEIHRAVNASATALSRCRLFANTSATSVDDLRSAHTPDSAFFRRMARRLTDNQAQPFAVAKYGAQEVDRFVLITPNAALDDLANDATWQNLLANCGVRGSGNYLFTGEVPSWNGATVLPWDIVNNSANAPQGSMCMPVAYTGAALDFSQTTARTVTGGGSAAAAALTDHLYFRGFAGAAFSSHEVTKITQETSATKYALIQDASTGKFGMISYTTTNGNTITGVEHTGASDSGARVLTLGNVTYNSGVWAGKMTTSFAIGSKVVPCNSYGVPYCYLYGIGRDAMMHGFGSVNGGGAGKRTVRNDDNMQAFSQIGFEEQWGISTRLDANAVPTGLVLGIAAYQLDGMPIIE